MGFDISSVLAAYGQERSASFDDVLYKAKNAKVCGCDGADKGDRKSVV